MKVTCISIGSMAIVLGVVSSSLASLPQGLGDNKLSLQRISRDQVLLTRTPIRISPTALESFLKRFRSRQFKLGSKTLSLGKNDIRHILQGHHRRFYNPEGRKSRLTQTFFKDRMEPDDVINAIESVIRQRRNELVKLGANGGQVEGIVHGVKYILGIDRRGRIHQFYPAY